MKSAADRNYVPCQIPDWLMTSYAIEDVVAALAILGEVLISSGYLKKKKATSKRKHCGNYYSSHEMSPP